MFFFIPYLFAWEPVSQHCKSKPLLAQVDTIQTRISKTADAHGESERKIGDSSVRIQNTVFSPAVEQTLTFLLSDGVSWRDCEDTSETQGNSRILFNMRG